MDWLHYNFTANGTSELKAWRVKNFVCCSSHNKRFNYPVFAVYKRHVTVALKIIISLWTGVWRQRERVTPCLDLVAVFCLLPKPFGRWHFCEALKGSYGAIVFFHQNTTIFFQKIKYLTQKFCVSFRYWLWIKRCWLQSQSQISKSCLSVGRYQILYLCGDSALWGQL